MLYYLDTVIVIYAVEGNPADQQRALNHLAALEQAGHRFAINELTLTECLVPVLGPGGGQRLSDFFRFFRRAEPADAGPDCRDVRPGQRYPGRSHIPSDSARSAEALRAGRRPPSRHCDRVRL